MAAHAACKTPPLLNASCAFGRSATRRGKKGFREGGEKPVNGDQKEHQRGFYTDHHYHAAAPQEHSLRYPAAGETQTNSIRVPPGDLTLPTTWALAQFGHQRSEELLRHVLHHTFD
jgi:hypothetical protein